MNNETTTTISTRMKSDQAAIDTNLTIQWDGMTPEDIQALAQQALIVKLQGSFRKNGIPATATIRAVDYKVGSRAARQPANLESLFAAMSAEEKAAFIEKATAALANRA